MLPGYRQRLCFDPVLTFYKHLVFWLQTKHFVPVLTIYENVGFWTLPSASARLWPRNQDSFPFEMEYWMGIVVD